MSYRAFVVNKNGDDFSAAVTELQDSDLPPGEVTIAVEWSCVNYKDGLAASPNGRVVRGYPMVPGIDLAGTVIESSDSRFTKGQGVVAIGYDLGVAHAGGYAEKARVPVANIIIPVKGGDTSVAFSELSIVPPFENGLNATMTVVGITTNQVAVN